MLRFIVILLASILLITVVRSIVGLILRGFAELVKTPSTPEKAQGGAAVPAGGELKKDPVCGTYVSAATALKKVAGASTVYFCSQACFDQYRG